MPDLPAIELADLTPAVRKALDAPGAEVTEWSADPIVWEDLGGGSRALHRVHGLARRAGSTVPIPWSIVLKTLLSTSDDGESSNDPVNYAYWRRESLVYSSGLLDDVAGGLRGPRCYAVDVGLDHDRLWLEDLRELHPEGWSLERFGLAARHLGQFNGVWLAGRTVPELPWLADLESVHDFWTTHDATQPGLAALLDSKQWREICRTTGVVDSGEPAALRAFLADRRPYLTALAALPQTLCHHDAMAPNLFAARAADGFEATVAIDWQLAGLGPAGDDLAMLVAGSVMFLRTPGGTLDELNERAIEGYLSGLEDVGASAAEADVRFAYAASTVLRMAAIVASWLRNLAQREDREFTEAFWRRPPETLVEHWAPLVAFLDRQAAHASNLPR
jgi:hypothetical protein